jgi:hypothetical protein
MMFVADDTIIRTRGYMLNVNSALTRELALQIRHCAAVAATRAKKKGTREEQAPDSLELGPGPKHGVRR